MAGKFTRDELVARLVRAGELEVSGEHQDELPEYFDVAGFVFHGPDGFESDFAGLGDYFASIRAAFDDRSIRRGIVATRAMARRYHRWSSRRRACRHHRMRLKPLLDSSRLPRNGLHRGVCATAAVRVARPLSRAQYPAGDIRSRPGSSAVEAKYARGHCYSSAVSRLVAVPRRAVAVRQSLSRSRRSRQARCRTPGGPDRRAR